MNLVDIIYAAGLFDGEGCPTASLNKSGYPSGRASLGNTYKPVLEWLQEYYGGSLNETNKGGLNHHRTKICYNLMLHSEGARNFLTDVIPYLRIKKVKAQAVLALLKCTPTTGQRQPPEENKLLRLWVFDVIKEVL